VTDPAYRHFRLLDAAPWWVLASAVVLAAAAVLAWRPR
jgi:hypothetical protein